MARRFPTFVVLLPLLAACATTAPTAHRADEAAYVTSADGQAVYLSGVTSRYSVRLDELRVSHATARESRLPHAVVAGDATMTVAGSLFRHGDVFTLDMIVRNHGEEPIEIDRAYVELYDDQGNELSPMLDWERGPEYGLRALQTRHRGYHHMGTDHQAGQAGVGEDRKPAPRDKGITNRVDQKAALKASETPMDISWISELAQQRELITLPAVIVLPPGEDMPYWAYWKGRDLHYPLTVSLRIGGKRMLLRFDDPGPMTAR